MELIQSLKNIGLNEKEAKIYLSLLELSRASAYQIAKNSGLKRPTVYVILEELVNKGVVRKIPGQKIINYSPTNPEELLAIIQSKIDSAQKALPELKALGRGRLRKKVYVSYYEGLSGIKEMYSKLCENMKDKEYVAFYAHGKNTPRELLEYFDELNAEHKKFGIKRRGITVKHPSLKKYLEKNNQKNYRIKLKTLTPDKYNSQISIEIYKNVTQIISHRYLQGILIENPDVAKVIKQIFELVWSREDCLEVRK